MGRPDFFRFPSDANKIFTFLWYHFGKIRGVVPDVPDLSSRGRFRLESHGCSFLNQSGYVATGCLRASDAYNALYQSMFDLIVSDIMMPEIDGFEFARTVRSLDENIPILFMTARDDFASKQRGYRAGIDDYMVKPIDLDELCLRIGALLRRAKIASSHHLEVGNFVMDVDEHTAYLGEEEISLTTREFNLLYKCCLIPEKPLPAHS